MNSATQAWDWLRRELDHWAEDGLQADFWWRDDDATDRGAKLDRLMQLSEDHSAPIALAIIPAQLQSGLSDRLREFPLASVLQHGYDHQSHARPGQRKLELGGDRQPEDVLQDLQTGYDILNRAFDSRLVPVMVPPWNRIDPGVVARLAETGFTGLSTMRVRRQAHPAPGLLQVNTHLDPVAWRQQRGFIGTYPAIAILVQHLVARRTGYRDIDEPTGILSHHLAQTDPVWQFLDRLLAFLQQHPAARFVDAASIWPAQAPSAKR